MTAEQKILKLYNALKRISAYASPERLHRCAEKEYGVRGSEAIEMAYENVIAEAKDALRGFRLPNPRDKKPVRQA
jgi:hypothetical protein